MIKSNKGISLITMGMSVLILVIILTTLVFTAIKNFKIGRINKLYTDLKTLSDEVSVYYLKNHQLPVSSEYATIEEGDSLDDKISFVTKDGKFVNKESLVNPNDYDSSGEKGKAVYYVLDVEVFNNITLSNTGRYIINEQSHTIYYVDGVKVDGTVYHYLKMNYKDIGYSNKSPISKITSETVYLPMGGTTLNLRNYLNFIADDGEITAPKSLKYTVITSSYEQYFRLDEGKIISTDAVAMPTPFKIRVEAESYGTSQVITEDLVVYLTDIAVWEKAASPSENTKITDITLIKGNEITLYVQESGSSGNLSFKTKVDSGNGIDVTMSNTAIVSGGITLYPLTIKATNAGKVTLTVLEDNGKASQEIAIYVYSATLNSDRLSPDGLVLSAIDEKEDITLKINDLFDINSEDNRIVWSSSDGNIVSVEAKDDFKVTITSLGYGTATLYCEITVDNQVLQTLQIPITIYNPTVDDSTTDDSTT